jgi:GTPase Era involved in 16S rRNA processing
MSFFQSEIVQTEMREISEIQEQIYKNVFTFSSMTKEDKLEHVELLEKLLKKQQVLYTRLSLSDDPEAKMMKDSIMSSAKQLGFPSNVDLTYIFNNMTHIVDNMKKSIEET